jgi:murein DD-endopeptidase MepM/ murein hydrolase activator NlpD
VGTPRDNTERGGFFLLFLLLALVPFALLGLGPDAGVAFGQEGDARVTGHGEAAFSSAEARDGVPACRFQVDASKDQTGSRGSFTCDLQDRSISLGLPFTNLTVEVRELNAPSPVEATLDGPAVVDLPDGGSMNDVPTSVHLLAGGPGTGGLQIVLHGVFDGRPGDETRGDGDYTLVPQVVTAGSIEIQLEGPSPSPSPSPSPTGSPTPSPTGSPSPSPTSSPSPHPSPTSSQPGPPVPPDPGLGVPPPSQPTNDPPFVLGGTHTTAGLMAILAALSPDGNPRLQDVLSVVGPFPVAGLAWWQNDWHAYRCCPRPHLHQGLDMFAPRGTPAVAAADGIVSQKVNGPVSGQAIEITDAAGSTQYFYAHLSGFGPGIGVGAHVHVGQVVGYIGNTGNASHTSPHLHFEVQPNGIPVPPVPFVDTWLVQSEQRALSLVQQRTGRTFALPDAATIRLWMRKALELAAQGTDEIGGEAALPGSNAHRLASTLLDLSRSGPLMAFATGALFLLILMPAVMVGRREADRRLERARGGSGRRIAQEEDSRENEPGAREEQPDPGALGRHRSAAR